MRKLIAIEGGWGSGKTTLLNSVDSLEVLPSVVPVVFDIIGRLSGAGPESTPEVFSSLFFDLRSKQLEKLAIEDGGPILCDRTLFAPIALRRFHGLPVPASFYTAIETLRDSGALHKTVFFADQIPMANLEKGWPKRRFNFGQAERYSKITESLIRSMRFSITKIPFAPMNIRSGIFKALLGNEGVLNPVPVEQKIILK